MSQPVVIEGGCFCGAVRYRITGQPAHVTNCHCSMCRRTSGAPFVAWAVVKKPNFAFTEGEPARLDSSSEGRRSFCGRCGTPLTCELSAQPELVDVTVCSMDDPAPLRPKDHIWTDSRVPWVSLDDDLPRYPEGWAGH
jgi:hypothetical protein